MQGWGYRDSLGSLKASTLVPVSPGESHSSPRGSHGFWQPLAMIREVGKGPEKKSREAKLARRNKVLNEVSRVEKLPLI